MSTISGRIAARSAEALVSASMADGRLVARRGSVEAVVSAMSTTAVLSGRNSAKCVKAAVSVNMTGGSVNARTAEAMIFASMTSRRLAARFADQSVGEGSGYKPVPMEI